MLFPQRCFRPFSCASLTDLYLDKLAAAGPDALTQPCGRLAIAPPVSAVAESARGKVLMKRSHRRFARPLA